MARKSFNKQRFVKCSQRAALFVFTFDAIGTTNKFPCMGFPANALMCIRGECAEFCDGVFEFRWRFTYDSLGWGELMYERTDHRLLLKEHDDGRTPV